MIEDLHQNIGVTYKLDIHTSKLFYRYLVTSTSAASAEAFDKQLLNAPLFGKTVFTKRVL